MTAKINIGSDGYESTIDINITEDRIIWTQHTGASVVWASNIVHNLARTFHDYKIENFSYVSVGGNYVVSVTLSRAK